jgi:hypothetical protein
MARLPSRRRRLDRLIEPSATAVTDFASNRAASACLGDPGQMEVHLKQRHDPMTISTVFMSQSDLEQIGPRFHYRLGARR